MAQKKTKGKIPGQGQPTDASTDLFWRDNKNFAEVFNKAVFNGLFVSPEQLEDLNVAESTMFGSMMAQQRRLGIGNKLVPQITGKNGVIPILME